MSGRGRGGKRDVARRDSLEGANAGSIRDVLDALEEMKGDFKKELKSVSDRLGKLEDLNRKLARIEPRLNRLEIMCRQVEINEKKNWIVIKNLWRQDDVQAFETRANLRKSLDELKELMEVDCCFMDYYRLKDFRKGQQMLPGLVKAKFVTSDDRDRFFSKISECGRKDDLKLISFQQDIPKFLIEKFKRLDKEAFTIRRNEKLKTRVVFRGQDLILQKRDAAGRWSRVADEPRDNGEGAGGAEGGTSDWSGVES
jgi:hypothetical protein